MLGVGTLTIILLYSLHSGAMGKGLNRQGQGSLHATYDINFERVLNKINYLTVLISNIKVTALLECMTACSIL